MSREEAIDLLDNLIGMVEDNHSSDYDTALQMGIKALEQEPQTGHWIKYGKLYQCSECEELSCCQGKFCNECGAKMVEPQEGENE